MGIDLRTVLDTGAVVSAVLLPRSVPRRAFDRAAACGKILVSLATLGELDDVLRRSKFDKYIGQAKRLEFFAAFARKAEMVEVAEVVRECRDPKDDKFLELEVSGGASHIISGDGDLLALHPFRSIAIVTPHDFLAFVQSMP
jgi:putative PIN family toxin of toxin-antitoxin system